MQARRVSWWFRRSLPARFNGLPAKLALFALIFIAVVAGVHVLALDRLLHVREVSGEVRIRWLDGAAPTPVISAKSLPRRRPGPGSPHPSTIDPLAVFPSDVRGAVQNSAGGFIEQVERLRVHALDQANFPDPLPFLDLLLAPDDDLHGLVHFVINEPVDAVALGKAVDEILLVNADARSTDS
jgi:hypothetical protein